MATDNVDLVIVGTGFASSFFLKGWLEKAPANARVLVLERGHLRDHAHQLRNMGENHQMVRDSYTNGTPEKPWAVTLGFGGGSNCWWACTPRMLPNDFRTRSTYGVGTDWPVTYDELEPFYCDVEEVMATSGPAQTPWPMSRPYPLPPHTLQQPDRLLMKAFPGRFIPQPTGRASQATPTRPKCCSNGVCGLCPINAKFTILNGLSAPYADPRVTLKTNSNVVEVLHKGNTATGVRYLTDQKGRTARAGLVALGANAIFNPWLLLRSGLPQGNVGQGLAEQRSKVVFADLNVDAFGGSTVLTGLGYLFADGEHRRSHAGAIVETSNAPLLNVEPGAWRRRWMLRFIFEDHPQATNVVELDPDDDLKPRVRYSGPSAYLERGASHLDTWARELLAPISDRPPRVGQGFTGTESHILCTHPMGTDPATSVTDHTLRHHKVRNLLVMGGGAFPTAPTANPTLTLSALALRAARSL